MLEDPSDGNCSCIFVCVPICIMSVCPGVGRGGLGERLGRLGGIRTEVRGHEAVHLQTWKKQYFYTTKVLAKIHSPKKKKRISSKKRHHLLKTSHLNFLKINKLPNMAKKIQNHKKNT